MYIEIIVTWEQFDAYWYYRIANNGLLHSLKYSANRRKIYLKYKKKQVTLKHKRALIGFYNVHFSITSLEDLCYVLRTNIDNQEFYYHPMSKLNHYIYYN